MLRIHRTLVRPACPSAPRRADSGDSLRRLAIGLLTLAVAAVVAASPSPLAAQQAEDLPALDTIPLAVEDLTVTVTRVEAEVNRTPESVSVLGEEALVTGEKQASIGEALRFVPGVFAQNRRNESLGDRLTVRGVGARAQFGVRGIQVLADGIPMTLPSGGAAINNLDLNSVGRVEVIRGPSSPLYGNAAGGVLSFQTRDPFAGSFQAEPEFTFGAYDYYKSTVGASGQSEDFGWRFSGTWTESDGFRDHAESESYQANLVTGWQISEDTRLQGVFNYFDLPWAQNPSTLTRDVAMESPRSTRSLIVDMGAGEENAQGQGGLTLDHRFSEGHRLEATVWGAFRDVWNPIPFSIIQVDRAVGGLRSEYQGSVTAGELPVRWTAGLDVGIQSDERKEFENDRIPDPSAQRPLQGDLFLEQQEQVVNWAPFVRVEVDFLPRWRLTLGGRYDDYEFDVDDRFLSDGDDSGVRNLDEFSPMAGLTYSPHEAVNLFANYATAFETPTTSEFSNRPDGSGGLNPDLGPANTESFEVGAKGRWEASRLRYGLALYTADVDGALVPFSGPQEIVFFRNAGQISRQGVEFSLDWNPVSNVLWQLAYTYQDSEFEEFTVEGEDFSGNREPGVPEHQLTAGMTYRAPFGLVSKANVRWVDAYPVNDANTASNWSYRVVDLRFAMDRPVDLGRIGLQPFLGIDNAFDERYNGSVVPNAFGGRFYEPAPGTNLYGGLSVSLSYR